MVFCCWYHKDRKYLPRYDRPEEILRRVAGQIERDRLVPVQEWAIAREFRHHSAYVAKLAQKREFSIEGMIRAMPIAKRRKEPEFLPGQGAFPVLAAR